jgi:NADH/NAD ratio-sensing transcriptional regulator Rex
LSAGFNLQKGDRALVRTFMPHLLNVGHLCALAYEAEAEINIMEAFDRFSQRKGYFKGAIQPKEISELICEVITNDVRTSILKKRKSHSP